MTNKTQNTRKRSFEEQMRIAREEENCRLNEERLIRELADEMASALTNQSLLHILKEDYLLLFDLKYDSKEVFDFAKGNDFRKRANMGFMWTLGLYEQVRNNDYPEVHHEHEAFDRMKHLYKSRFFTKKNYVFRSEQNFSMSCADGLGYETNYVTLPGAKSLDDYVYPLIKELALGKNKFDERVKLDVPYGGIRWIDYDKNISNQNIMEIEQPITPKIFREILRYVTKDKIKF